MYDFSKMIPNILCFSSSKKKLEDFSNKTRIFDPKEQFQLCWAPKRQYKKVFKQADEISIVNGFFVEFSYQYLKQDF
jgi:hypothetical protein